MTESFPQSANVAQFLDKQCLLQSSYPELPAFDFYRLLFPEGSFERLGHQEDGKGNGIAVSIDTDGRLRGRKTIVTDGLEQLPELLQEPFVVMSPISYYGRSRKASNALWMYALVFDVDSVSLNNLKTLLYWIEELEDTPRPTAIVNSGHGLHLYYMFEEPIPMYPEIQAQLKKLKASLTGLLWNPFTSTIEDPEYLGVVQGFRMVGSAAKGLPGCKVTAFQTGEKINLDYLNVFVPKEDRAVIKKAKTTYTLTQAQELFPDWYNEKIVHDLGYKKWHIKRDLYDWYKAKISTDLARVGHRYFCIMCLAAYASKCDIPYEELEKDVLELQPYFDQKGSPDNKPFTVEEAYKAMDVYFNDYNRFPRSTIEKISGISMPANRRNGRKQEAHLKRARYSRDLNQEEAGTRWQDNAGAPDKRQLVLNYVAAHPGESQRQIAAALEISPTTVNKWLKTINQSCQTAPE